MGFYVTQAAGESIQAYKYNGEDRSLLYRYVLHPLAGALVQLVPSWIAPNLITVFGLLVLSIAAEVTYLHSPDLTDDLPHPVSKLCALSLLLYQTLDNLDGKQARKTGNSSPMGLLMDHGVDALAVTITTLMMCAVFQTGSNMYLFSVWLLGMIPFTFATWEEYYTNSLILGVVNGPSDGLALGACCCLLPVLYGADFWKTPWAPLAQVAPAWIANLPRSRFVIALLWAAVVPTIAMNTINVVRVRRARGKSLMGPITTLGPFLFLVAAAFIWLHWSPSRILSAYPRWCMLTLGFVFGNIACKLMLAHVGNHRYRVRRYSLIPLVAAAINSLAGAPFDEIHMAIVTLTTAAVCWLHFVIIAGWEVTELLGIRMFVVNKQERKLSLLWRRE